MAKKPYLTLSQVLHGTETVPANKVIHLTDHDAAHLLKHGVITSTTADEAEDKPVVTAADVKVMKIDELKAYAEAAGIEIVSTKKADILAEILAVIGDEESD